MEHVRSLLSQKDEQMFSLLNEYGFAPQDIQQASLNLKNGVTDIVQKELTSAKTEQSTLEVERADLVAHMNDIAIKMGLSNHVAQLDKENSLLQQLTSLRAQAQAMDEQYEARSLEIDGRRHTLTQLGSALGLEAPAVENPDDFTDDLVASLDAEIASLQQLTTERENIVNELMDGIFALWHALAIPQERAQSDLDKSILLRSYQNIGLSEDTVNALQARMSQFESFANTRQMEIQKVMNEIETIWQLVDRKDEDQQVFIETASVLGEQYGDLSPNVLAHYKEEFERMKVTRSNALIGLIETLRTQLETLWDTLTFTTQMKEDFLQSIQNKTAAAMAKLPGGDEVGGADNESVLNDITHTMMTDEVERLTLLMNSASDILKLAANRDAYKEQLTEFELSSNDSNRLNTRHSFRILAHEEKMRKVQKVKLPNIEKKLLSLLYAWEKKPQNDNNETAQPPFLRYGVRFIDVILKDAKTREEAEIAKMEIEKKVRQARKLQRQSDMGLINKKNGSQTARNSRPSSVVSRRMSTVPKQQQQRRDTLLNKRVPMSARSQTMRTGSLKQPSSRRETLAGSSRRQTLSRNGKTTSNSSSRVTTTTSTTSRIPMSRKRKATDSSQSGVQEQARKKQAVKSNRRSTNGNSIPRSKDKKAQIDTETVFVEEQFADKTITTEVKVVNTAPSSSSSDAVETTLTDLSTSSVVAAAPSVITTEVEVVEAKKEKKEVQEEEKVVAPPVHTRRQHRARRQLRHSVDGVHAAIQRSMKVSKADMTSELDQLAMQADTLLAQKQYKEAVAILSQAIEASDHPRTQSTLYHQRSKIHGEHLQDYDQAVKDSDEAIKLNNM